MKNLVSFLAVLILSIAAVAADIGPNLQFAQNAAMIRFLISEVRYGSYYGITDTVLLKNLPGINSDEITAIIIDVSNEFCISIENRKFNQLFESGTVKDLMNLVGDKKSCRSRR